MSKHDSIDDAIIRKRREVEQEEKKKFDDDSYIMFLLNDRTASARDSMEAAIIRHDEESREYWELEVEYSAGVAHRFMQEMQS